MYIKNRLAIAGLIVALTVACTLICRETRMLFWTALAVMSAFELEDVLKSAELPVSRWYLSAYIVLHAVMCYVGAPAVWFAALFFLAAFGAMLWGVLCSARGGRFAAASLFALVWPFGFYAVILHAAASELWLPAFAVGVLGAWACDSIALVCGKLFGKHKIAPRVSPNKTWEGTIAGGLAAILAGWLICLILRPFFPIPALPCVALTFAVSCVGQLGDLAASLIKRMAGVKDFGSLMPEHGGILDKTDSMLFAVPTAYFGIYLLGALA